MKNFEVFFCIGIGYIRWVIYGILIDRNVYFYYSESKDVVFIYNGIIENYVEIKKELLE